MKIFGLLSVGLFSAISYAQPMPLVAELVRTPGYTPAAYAFINKTQIFYSLGGEGIVNAFRQKLEDGTTTQRVIAKLPLENITKIMAYADSVQPGALINLNAGQPPCSDAPSYSWRVIRGGEVIVLKRTANCHTYQLENLSNEGSSLVNILTSLQSLAQEL